MNNSQYFGMKLFTLFCTVLFCGIAGSALAVPSYTVIGTGQELCFSDEETSITCPSMGEAFYGQDRQTNGFKASYTDNGDGTVTDNNTGLIWQKSPDINGDGNIDVDDTMYIADVTSYAESLSLAGHDDWRLPTIKELYSLIKFTGTDSSNSSSSDTSVLTPFIDTDYFEFAYGDTDAGERVIDAQYASSTSYVSTVDNDLQFGLNFADGRIKGYPPHIKKFYVHCVRGDSYGDNDFTDNGDSTITDNSTGLMWTQNDSGQGLNWEEALAWVVTKNSESYLGHNDWRLPNAKELQSIVDYTRSPDTTSSPAINAVFNTTSITNEEGAKDYPYFWTSTTHKSYSSSGDNGEAAAYVSFGRALGYVDDEWTDIHGAGAQRSEFKSGDPNDYPEGYGPQNDAVRIYNYVRLVRDPVAKAPIWHNTSSGQSVNWLVNSSCRLKDSQRGSGWNFISSAQPTSWTMEGVVAISGTNYLLWRNTGGAGKMVYWKLNDSFQLSSTTEGEGWGFISSSLGLDSSWSFVGTVDIDDNTSLIWQNQSQGKFIYWKLNSGCTLKNDTQDNGWGYVSDDVTLNSSWSCAGALNISDTPYLFFQNANTGNVVYWKLNSSGQLANNDQGSGWGNVASSSGNAWNLKGASTLSDDYALLLKNSDSGKVVYWKLNDSGELQNTDQGSGWGFVSTELSLDSNWSLTDVVTISDDPVIYWSNSSTGELMYWKLNSSGSIRNNAENSGWGYASDSALNSNWSMAGIVE